MRKVSFGSRREIGPRGKFQPCFSDHLNFPLESDGKLRHSLRKKPCADCLWSSEFTEAPSFRPTRVSGPQLVPKHVSQCLRWEQAAGGGCLARAFTLGPSLLEAGHQGRLRVADLGFPP